jgi:hypothetical protein
MVMTKPPRASPPATKTDMESEITAKVKRRVACRIRGNPMSARKATPSMSDAGIGSASLGSVNRCETIRTESGTQLIELGTHDVFQTHERPAADEEDLATP